MNHIFNDIRDITMIGDVHGEWDKLLGKIKDYDLNNFYLFVLGDFGVGFGLFTQREVIKENRRLANLNTSLKKRNITMFVIRGNHDNVSFFDGTHNLSNLVFLSDYDTIQLNEKNFLAVGGGLSIDRFGCNYISEKTGRRVICKPRKLGYSYWEDELPVYDEEKINIIPFNIDIVLAHTAPHYCYPFIELKNGDFKQWEENYPNLIEDMKNERKIMTKIFEKLMGNGHKVLNFFYGHFHETHREGRDGINFILLDILEFREFRT